MKTITVSGCRMYRIRVKFPTCQPTKSAIQTRLAYTDSDSESMTTAQNLQTTNYRKDAKERMGKTFAAIFNMLRQPPEVDEDDSEEEFNNQKSNRRKLVDLIGAPKSSYGSSDYPNQILMTSIVREKN